MRQLHFIVNPSSGGGRGGRLAADLAAVVGHTAVSILGRGDLSAIISRMNSEDAIIACGGDGTASAVAATLATLAAQAARADGPALGVVPLGTGNDLARTLGWASFSPHHVTALVATLRVASYRYHDCWRLDGPGGSRVWCNYLSVGVDAQVAQHFHHLRLRHPWLARGGLINRGLYGLLGAQQRGLALTQVVRVADELRLPRSASVMVLSNILSYAGGATLARGIRMDDRQFEVVALGHGLRLGLATAGLRRPRLVSRRDQMSFDLGCDLAMQTDGEAFTALAGRYDVAHAGIIKTLVAESPR